MIKPEFPFLNNQIILSSDRVILHTKSDTIFLFGKGAVSLSSPNTVNVDAGEKVIVYSPRIELGFYPSYMEPTMKGRTFSVNLGIFLDDLIKAFEPLRSATGPAEPPPGLEEISDAIDNLATAAMKIVAAAQSLKNICETADSDSAILSKNTFVS